MDRAPETIDPSNRNGREDVFRRLGRSGLVAVVGVLGIVAVHHPMILSGFRRIQTDLGDPRLLNYLMEHGWLWLNGAAGHRRFWDAPFFHPVPNVIAFTDSMFSYGPFYWPFRLVGFTPEVAFGLFLIVATALNYATGVLLFRRGLGFGAPATAAASGLIAFGSPRVNQVGHAQLLPFFYVLLALYVLCRIARDESASAVVRVALWVAFALAVAAQFYGGVYLGWFFGVGLLVATALGLILRTSRDRVAALIRREWWAAAIGAAVGAIALIPLLTHYLPVAREYGGTFNDVQRFGHQTSLSWLKVGPKNWLWGWVDRFWPDEGDLFMWELWLGIGFVTTVACAVGFILGRRSPLGRLAVATTAMGVLGMTNVPNNWVVLLAAAAACYALGCLFREPDWTEQGAGTIALTTVLLLLCPPFNDLIRSLTLVLIGFCWARMWRERRSGDMLGMLAPGTALILLSLHLLPWTAMAMLGPAAIASGYLMSRLRPEQRVEIGLATFGLFLIGTAALSFESRPEIPRDAVLGGAFGWASSRGLRWRPNRTWLLRTPPIAVAVVYMMSGSSSLWYACSPYIPGSQAIRMPGRVILILLVPAAFGLAALVEHVDRGRRGMAAWGLVLLCLLEQTQTTHSYAVAESRARIAAIAHQIDPAAESFYYRPVVDREESFVMYNLDAMWASLVTGIPTINGDSGCFPRGWEILPVADTVDKPTTEQALGLWCTKHGLDRERIQRIGRQPQADEEAAEKKPPHPSVVATKGAARE